MESGNLPSISVIMPVRNEGAMIDVSLGSVIRQDYPADKVQVLVADGRSDDDTRDRIQRLKQKFQDAQVQILDNAGLSASAGFNLGLKQATAELIVRVDGHCELPQGYLRRCARMIQERDAICVGGCVETIGQTVVARTIAKAQSSKFGVGGVSFRVGAAGARSVDTLAFGAYRRRAFEQYGGYDPELIRNQDDEFNFRLTQSGETIWMDPELVTKYFSRASFKKLWWQYFEYGLYKVRVIQKRRAIPSPRHLVPAVFVASVVSCAILGISVGNMVIALLPLLPYTLVNVLVSAHAARGNLRQFVLLPLAFAILHTAYGCGFIFGLWRWRKHWGDGAAAL